jgi:hypothetical protein
MNTNMYYQQNNNDTNNSFEPIYRKKAASPYFHLVRNMGIISTFFAVGLFLFNFTFFTPIYHTELDIDFKYSTLDDSSIIDLFDNFKKTYNKTYATIEEATLRYNNFRSFLLTIDERNGNDTHALHGVTKFADLSPDEFRTNYLGYKPPMNSNKLIIELEPYSGNESIINWADIYTTAVKDQGYCGSCWAFSATEQIESDSIRLGLLTTSDTLSTEQIVQCDTVDDGCGGGNTETAFEYVRSAGGIESDSDYPYTSYYDYTGSCSSNSLKYKVTVDEYYSLSGEDSMITHIFSSGPISVCLDASSWSSYVSGVITTCGMEVDHCVQAVGVNLDEWYWVVRNSWGTEWGNEGYIWLEAGSNMCNIAYDPTYVVTSVV